MAVIEFDSSINPESIGTEFGDTSYHTVVTVFEPDVERNEMPYDYAEELLSNPDNIELERVKKAFEDAYRADTKTQKNTADGGVNYSLSKDVDGNVFVDVTEDIFDANNGESVARTIQKVIAERFHNLIDVHGQKIQINKTTNDEFRRSESANDLLKRAPQAYSDKLKTIANADEILTAARNWIGEATKHQRKDDIVEFARANVAYRVGGHGYVADVIVGTRKNGAAVLYDLVNIFEKEITEAPVTMASNDSSQRRQDASVGRILPRNSDGVKHSLSAEQQEYFKDSVVRDESGNLKVMYHGTPNGDFTVFKDGTYFTENKEYADTYQNPGASSISTGKTATNPKTFEVYRQRRHSRICPSGNRNLLQISTTGLLQNLSSPGAIISCGTEKAQLSLDFFDTLASPVLSNGGQFLEFGFQGHSRDYREAKFTSLFRSVYPCSPFPCF